MTRRLHVNNFVTTLASDISSGATSISITSATGFPAVGSGAVANVTLANGSTIEIVTCTAISGTTLTVTRGAEGTTPAAFVAGSTVSIRPTADSVDRKLDEDSYTTTATAAGTTTLTVDSNRKQYFTGSTTQTVVLPVTSTLALGRAFKIVNESSGVVTVQSSGANTIQAMAANTILDLECILTSGTGIASWYAKYSDKTAGGGSVIGPASATDNAAVRFDGTTGKLVQNSEVIISDSNAITGAASITTSADSSFNSVSIGRGASSVSTNTAVGTSTLAAITSGTGCSAFGYQAGQALTSALNNTAFGSEALKTNTTANNNAAFGQSALKVCTGSNNAGFGINACFALQGGSNNIGFGTSSLFSLTSGDDNLGIGYLSGQTITTGTRNIIIGGAADVDTNDAAGTIAIGYSAVSTKSTGSTSSDNGPGIAIGSSTAKVGFRGNGTIYPGNLWRVKVNGTQYMIPLAADGSTALPVANGGTNATSAGITAFNNITGYTAAGATGTTSTNLVFSTSPTLTTPTLGVASATSINFGQDALNYYDEGTFTPTFTFGFVGDLSVVYTNQTGEYTRIGRMVYVSFRVDFTPTYTTSSGNARFGGLPFTVNGSVNGPGNILDTNTAITWPATYTSASVIIAGGTTYANVIFLKSAGNSATLDTAGLASGVAVRIVWSGFYLI